ncbi:MAG: hypothetical protein ACI9DF_001018, partial [Verrucomicrobiales bacterium]
MARNWKERSLVFTIPDREVEFEATIGGKKEATRDPYAKIHRVVWNGKKYIVTKKPAGGAALLGAGAKPNGTSLRGFIEDFSRRVFISEMLEIAVPGFLQPS